MKTQPLAHHILFLACFLMASCLPEQTGIRDLAYSGGGIVNDSDSSSDEDSSSGISEINFFQQAAVNTSATLSLYYNFSDSFLMRGDNVHAYLKGLGTNPKKLCMVFSFPFSTSKKALVLAARRRSYYNPVLEGREYYLQMEPANESANIGDCLSVEMTNAVGSAFGTSAIAYTLDAVCPTCGSNLTSSAVKIFGSNGANIGQIQINNLGLKIVPSQGGGGTTGQTCSSDTTCRVAGFNCCLQGQCVNHGETRPSVDTSDSGYLSALEQILARPELIADYTEYFYVCPELSSSDPNGSDDGGATDPNEQADELLTELQDLYTCLNPVVDEFSICSKEAAIDLDSIGSGGTQISAGVEDLTFQNLNPNLSINDIVEVEYAGTTIYKAALKDGDTEVALDSDTTFSSPNDNLTDGQSVTVDKAIPAGATKNTIKIKYRVDGSCERIGSSIAKCTKTYVQGQTSSPARSSDHASGDNSFKLPSYADFSYTFIVTVGGVTVPMGSDTWQQDSVNSEIDFNYSIYDNQTVSISYFVTSGVDSLMASKDAALEQVDIHCKCDDEAGCNLRPVYETINGAKKLVNYACEYGQPDTPDTPLQETVYLSSKTVPHRYYDKDGVHYEADDIASAQTQEGTAFAYTSGNYLRPNNQSSYIGFNEIYGSFDRKEISAMPATVVDISKGKQYDLFVDSGSFSSCLNCGTDYFSNLQKLFPGNFLHMGGGYLPDMVESRRRDNRGSFSGTDMKFGRACFVPATMIPWTHKTNTDVTEQRRGRLRAQHFLFANGYNKDWYGFDYGSLIGSFDGVRWFSVGNQRRIQAKSNKLYLAINAYFGDLTIDNTFKVTVSELSSIVNSGSAITHDTESDGAQCQLAHYCSTDNDCIAQLGYEYTCQNVSDLYTPWPVFDSNGNETSGSTQLSLLSLVGGSNGQAKRCVYRGAGSLCEQNLQSISASLSYAASNSVPLHACSANTYCAELGESKFNDRIARYAATPATQNNQSYITNEIGVGDTFGLAARLIGRPFDLYGSKPAPSGVENHLSSLNVNSMCVPGKNPLSGSDVASLNTHSSGSRSADEALGIGKTYPDYILQNRAYYAACPATDDDEDFTHNNQSKLGEALNDHTARNHAVFASAQNLSTNALDLSVFDNLGLFNDGSSATTKVGYNKASCLRAPGASCYSDMDCSPNSFISQKIRSLASLGSALSKAEENFWEEELVCANSQERYLAGSIYPNSLYELNEHKCCRETGKDFTYASQRHMESDFEVVNGDDPSGEILLPGVNQSINSPRRYSRTHTVYDKLVNERSKYPPLYAAGAQRSAPVTYDSVNELLQYNTLHLNNSRMCCTGNWVRNFASGSSGNGGGHKFTGPTQQKSNKENFKYLSWSANNQPALNDFGTYDVNNPPDYLCTEEDYLTADCEVKNISSGSADETKWLEWFGKLELLGIPQVLVETNLVDYNQPLDDSQNALGTRPLSGTIKNINTGEGVADAVYNSKSYYSAASYDNFEVEDGSLKKVFSEDSFSCCVPTGIEVDGSMPDTKCCTGQVNTENAGQANETSRCCLNDFADLSVYTNRYVSSEGAYLNGAPISDADIDPETGYIRKELVLQMASTMCCSGKASYGVALGDYFIPMTDGVIQSAKSRRWLYDETLDDANEVGNAVTLFDLGLKWNNHVYCVPEEGVDSGSGASEN